MGVTEHRANTCGWLPWLLCGGVCVFMWLYLSNCSKQGLNYTCVVLPLCLYLSTFPSFDVHTLFSLHPPPIHSKYPHPSWEDSLWLFNSFPPTISSFFPSYLPSTTAEFLLIFSISSFHCLPHLSLFFLQPYVPSLFLFWLVPFSADLSNPPTQIYSLIPHLPHTACGSWQWHSTGEVLPEWCQSSSGCQDQDSLEQGSGSDHVCAWRPGSGQGECSYIVINLFI